MMEKEPAFKRFRVLHVIIFINVVFIVLTASIILISMWSSSEKNARVLSESLINEMRNSVSNRMINYFAPVAQMNQSMAALVYRAFQNPAADPYAEARLFEQFGEILRLCAQAKMVYYSDTTGQLIMLNRMSDGTFSKRRVANDGREIRITWEHVNAAHYGNYPNTVESAGKGYDPRKRGWYQLAEDAQTLVWTQMYLFATDRVPGFTCAAPIYQSDGKLSGVVCIDIAADELSRFLGTMQPTPNTKIVLIDQARNLVALQAKDETDLQKLFVEQADSTGAAALDVRNVSEYPDTAERYIYNKLLSLGEGMQSIDYDGSRYRAVLSPVSVGAGLDLSIGIIIPEDDILGAVRRSLYLVTLISILILIPIILCCVLLSNAIARPLRELSVEMSKIKAFELDSTVSVNTPLYEINTMQDSFDGMRQGLKNFKRYVPSELVAQLINQDIEAGLGGENREMTVFFSDIAKFTSISEQAKPENLIADLCAYFECVSKTILANKGTIDKYIGDSVMAFWGAPVVAADHAESACRSAVIIQNELHRIFRQWHNAGKEAFYTRIGIHTGEVIVGNMGYNERLNYTVIGDTVNVASRLEGVSKVYGTKIIVSENTWKQCGDLFEFRKLDKIAVMGRKEGLAIYELYAEKNDIERPLRKIFNFYETGLEYYFERKWAAALKYFDSVLRYRTNDGPARVMRERCLHYQAQPPAADWNGVNTLLSK
jgi:adenylate cyclase